jgi:hypothetical protein
MGRWANWSSALFEATLRFAEDVLGAEPAGRFSALLRRPHRPTQLGSYKVNLSFVGAELVRRLLELMQRPYRPTQLVSCKVNLFFVGAELVRRLLADPGPLNGSISLTPAFHSPFH